ncbi:V-type proton ATPase subunit D-like isoform X2 [Paramacrobiotus metropolitanus]|uniref:V-type proton ATPase subunit D-like isoform X2 n=1 Tax=Paramacrobiotus metropolitanus TaxID=2943436 RepID=UPI0024462CB2|nr:V-type proton ATPase subunit D-like isoform X2 [Paramacrobiotus metropolitanus]
MESGGKDRINVYPSRVALTGMRNRLTLSEKGANLLQKRADALAFHYRAKSNKALRNILEMQLAVKKARISMAEVNFIAGNQNHQILECVGPSARLQLKINIKNIAGVKLLDFEEILDTTGTDRSRLIGLGRAGDAEVFPKGHR